MGSVLDTSVFFLEYPLAGDLYTTPSVVAELIDLRSKCRYESLLAQGLQVRDPRKDCLVRVHEAACRAGDAERLSATDAGILALALELKATILSDDFAVQNIAYALSIPVKPIQQKAAKRRRWKFRCSGCGRFSEGPGECRVCGSKIKRTIK